MVSKSPLFEQRSPYSSFFAALPETLDEISARLSQFFHLTTPPSASFFVLALLMHCIFAEHRKEKTMTSSTHDKRWKELCEAIVDEPDSKRLMELVEKLNRVLEEREKQLKGKDAAGDYQR
jgi:hypothetical protein